MLCSKNSVIVDDHNQPQCNLNGGWRLFRSNDMTSQAEVIGGSFLDFTERGKPVDASLGICTAAHCLLALD